MSDKASRSFPSLKWLRNIDRWERFCAWLEDRPYNASYTVPRIYVWLTMTAEQCSTPDTRRAGRNAADVRREYQLIYWASGYGWRLRKNYKERLAELRQEAMNQ